MHDLCLKIVGNWLWKRTIKFFHLWRGQFTFRFLYFLCAFGKFLFSYSSLNLVRIALRSWVQVQITVSLTKMTFWWVKKKLWESTPFSGDYIGKIHQACVLEVSQRLQRSQAHALEELRLFWNPCALDNKFSRGDTIK